MGNRYVVKLTPARGGRIEWTVRDTRHNRDAADQVGCVEATFLELVRLANIGAAAEDYLAACRRGDAELTALVAQERADHKDDIERRKHEPTRCLKG